jgi:hypothetical protein
MKRRYRFVLTASEAGALVSSLGCTSASSAASNVKVSKGYLIASTTILS